MMSPIRCMARVRQDNGGWPPRLRELPLAPALAWPQVTSASNDEKLAFGHLLDGKADAFSAEPRILHTAIGHRVHAKRRRVVHDEPTDLQAVEGSTNAADILREDGRLK